ncbi:hypothetical protein CD133_05960 [Staphylococcus massiliensis CCUG 55927]|uniref:Uncharacterized protein n=1 Tax=Staphylococcus massiliensis S46 TaxID=1229783 RepID=K9ASZ1_9STAP|nr:hypothetical protein C273_00185 [Staphylococcus massiliensis S46]PNZ99752.1 hypothetical protein CD133_05960 [Staphylococcus massiliensis CCUG 55927]
MSKSLFRTNEVIELLFIYLFCLIVNSLITYISLHDWSDYIVLESYISLFIDYQNIIIIAVSFISLVYHYQFNRRKATEVRCKIIVGDYLFNLLLLHISLNLMILLLSFSISSLINLYFNIPFLSNFSVLGILVIYIFISIGMMIVNDVFKKVHE